MEQKKYNYFYKITNLINNHYYYGIHSTDNLDDGYMGSGKRLHYAYKKYGIENFTKEILKYFDTRKDASDYEAEMVTEQLVNNDNCYNCRLGGEEFKTSGMVSVYDTVENITKWVTQETYHSSQNRYISCSKGKVLVINKSDNLTKKITTDEFYKNKDNYIAYCENSVSVKDSRGNYYRVSLDDIRYVNGELVPIWKGRNHSEETKEKLHKTFKKIKHQQGQKNSHYGTCWITKDGVSKPIIKKELDRYISEGWIKGRKCNLKSKKIDKIKLNEVLSLREKGYTWKEIQKELDICHTTMYIFKKNNNLL